MQNNLFIIIIFLFITTSCEKKKVLEYYKNSLIKEYEAEINSDSIYDGKVVFYHKNGKIESTSFWENGIQDGETEFYFYNGKLNSKACWKKGIQYGYFLELDSLGRILKEGKYNDKIFTGFEYVYIGDSLYKYYYSKNNSKYHIITNLKTNSKDTLYTKIDNPLLAVYSFKDSINFNKSYFNKLIINDLIADSIIVFKCDGNEVIYQWPKMFKTSFLVETKPTKLGLNEVCYSLRYYYKKSAIKKWELSFPSDTLFKIKYFVK